MEARLNTYVYYNRSRSCVALLSPSLDFAALEPASQLTVLRQVRTDNQWYQEETIEIRHRCSLYIHNPTYGDNVYNIPLNYTMEDVEEHLAVVGAHVHRQISLFSQLRMVLYYMPLTVERTPAWIYIKSIYDNIIRDLTASALQLQAEALELVRCQLSPVNLGLLQLSDRIQRHIKDVYKTAPLLCVTQWLQQVSMQDIFVAITHSITQRLWAMLTTQAILSTPGRHTSPELIGRLNAVLRVKDKYYYLPLLTRHPEKYLLASCLARVTVRINRLVKNLGVLTYNRAACPMDDNNPRFDNIYGNYEVYQLFQTHIIDCVRHMAYGGQRSLDKPVLPGLSTKYCLQLLTIFK